MRAYLTTPAGLLTLLGLLILIALRLLPSDPDPLAPIQFATLLTARLAITFIVLIAALYIILSQKYQTDTEKWAYGTIGLLLGYWLPAA